MQFDVCVHLLLVCCVPTPTFFFHIFLLIEFQFDCSFLEAMGAMGGNI